MICNKCKVDKPKEDFHKSKASKRGIAWSCKDCMKIYRREHYLRNKEKVAEQTKRYNEENAELVKQRRQTYRDNNKEKMSEYWHDNKETLQEYHKNYYETNKERIKIRDREYYEKNKERYRKQARERRNNNYEEYLAKEKIWRDANLDKRLANNEKRRTMAKNLPSTLTLEEWQETLETFNHKCVYCGEDWEHRDHFIPLSKGGGWTKENIVPACQVCNNRKKAKSPDKFCGKEKANEIREKIGCNASNVTNQQ